MICDKSSNTQKIDQSAIITYLPGTSKTKYLSTLVTHNVLDFMSKMRKMSLGQSPNLGAGIDANITSASCILHYSECIHPVVGVDAGVQASVTLRDVGVVLLELLAS